MTGLAFLPLRSPQKFIPPEVLLKDLGEDPADPLLLILLEIFGQAVPEVLDLMDFLALQIRKLNIVLRFLYYPMQSVL